MAKARVEVAICMGSTQPRSSSRGQSQHPSAASRSSAAPTNQDLVDGLQVWCNYQVAHHLWPELTLLRYQRNQPRLRALLAEHGVPYRREPIWRRFRASLDLYLGRAEHPPAPGAAALL